VEGRVAKHDNPSHYGSKGVPPPVTRENLQIIEILEQEGVNYNEAMVLKYVYRHRRKNGLEDLDKAQWHLNRLREQWLAKHTPPPSMEDLLEQLKGGKNT
jgi:Protein of unknwon function (DUF3310)